MTSWCPPLFDESPKRYTKRLFLYATDEIAELLRQKYGIKGYVADHYEYMAHMAWLSGASSAAQALIREVDLVTSAWGKGDEQKTLSLIKVCIAHMISAWLGGIDQQPRLTGDDRRLQYQSAASNLFSIVNRFLGTRPSDVSAVTGQDMEGAVDMDRQWIWENDNGGPRLAYSGLILSKALEACGERCLQWERVVLPVQSLQHLLDMRAVLSPRLLEDHQRLLRVTNCLDQGVQPVQRFYVMNMEGKVRPSQKP